MKNNLKNTNFLANRELSTPPYNSHCLATLADGRPTVEWYTEPLLCNFFGLPIFPLGRGTKGVFRRNLKKVAMLLCVLMLAIGNMWGEDYNLIVDGKINTTDFYQGAQSGSIQSNTYTVEGVEYKKEYAFAGAVNPTTSSAYQKIVSYNFKTTQTHVKIVAYNKASSQYNLYIAVKSDGDKFSVSETEAVSGKSGKVVYEEDFTNTKGTTLYIGTANNSNLYLCQVTISETGTNLPLFGEPGYQLTANTNGSRFWGTNAGTTNWEGASLIKPSSNTNTTSTAIQVAKSATFATFKTKSACSIHIESNATSSYPINVLNSSSEIVESITSTPGTVSLQANTTYSLAVGGGSNRNINLIKFVASTYTVTFDANGHGTAPAKQENIGSGEKVTKPADLEVTGYTFDGWYTDKACPDDKKWDFDNSTVTENITLYAKWTAKTYDITLDANGGAADGSATVIYDGGVTSYTPATPSGEGQTLLGYFDAETGGNKIIDASGNLVADKWTSTESTMTLYAQWATSCTVRFMANGEVFDTQTVGLGGNATTPEGTPEALTGKGFGGWSDADGGAAVDVESITINSDKDFYAVWKDLRTVSFATGCGSAIDPVTVIDGQPVAKPADPTRTNWEVTKWQLEEADYDFSTPVTSDIELTAVWQRKTISGSTEDITLIDGTSVKSVLSSEWKYSTSTANNHVKFAGGMNGESGSRFITFVIPEGKTGKVKNATIHSDKTFVIIPESQVTESTRTFDYSNPYFSLKGSGKTETDATVNNDMPAGKYYCGSTSSGLEISKLVITLSSSPITATFKDGEVVKHTVSATANEELGNLFWDCELPALADHDGMTFLGWYNGENQVTEETTISASTTYTAKWQGAEHALTWTIGEGATITTPGTTAGSVEAGKPLTAPVVEREGYRFNGWIPEVHEVMPNYDAEYVAQWVKVFNVTYMDGETELGKEIVDEGQKASEYASYQNQPLATFQGWFDAATDGNTIKFTAKTIDADLIAYGKWDIQYAQTVDFEALAKNHTSETTTDIVDVLDTYHYSLTMLNGVVWDNNALAADLGLKIGDHTTGREFSFWAPADMNVTIKLGSISGYNGGTVSMDWDGKTETLYGVPNQDAQGVVNGPFTTTKDTKFVIKFTNDPFWSVIQKISITGTTPHNITLDPATNGSFTVKGLTEGVTAVEGENVALVANPDPHYGLKEWSVYKTGEETTKVTVNNNSFVMPAYAVTVAATFELVTSTDATLSDLKVDGTTIAGFSPDKYEYNVELPYKTTDIPEVTATKNNEFASDLVITQATSLPGTATVKVTAEDKTTTATYTVNFTVAPKDGVSIIKAVASGTTTIGTVTGALAGSAKISTSSGYKMDTKKYFMVALADNQKFQAGDVVEINVCSVNDGNGFTLYTKMNGDDFSSSDLIIDTHDSQGAQSKVNSGVNRITLPKSYTGSNAIYVGRAGSGDKYLNAGVNQVEVLRAMNPMLTAMKINGNDATINEEGKTVTIELPNNGGVVPTISFSDIKIISNTPSLTEGVLAEGEWAFDVARNYTLTDKDGDAIVYAITLTEAAAPCETPAINTQPESASYCAGDEMPTLSVDASVSDEGTLVYAWFKKGDTDEQVGNAVSYQVAVAGTYYVKVKNTKDGFGDSEWVISNDAVVTLNVAAAITTQPVGATEKEVGDHITLSVTATNATGYQWYKDEEAIDGETNDTYEFDFAATASYYVMVGSACGEDVKSDVVSVIAAPQGCNTFASIPSAAPYIYKQEGEWEITALTSNGKLDGSNRFINSATDYKGQTNQNALSYSRIGIKFAQATTSVTFYSSASSSRTFSSLKVTSDDIAGGTVSYSDVTDDVTVTKEDYNGNNKNGVFTATGFFEPNKYYWFTFSGTVVITKVCTTEAEVLEETKTISAATVNSVDLTTEQLSTLNSAKALTWDKVLTQPEVAMTYTITRKYEGDRTFVTDEEKTATITSDASNYYATCTFEGQDYVITCPIDKDPAMSLSVETLDVSFALSAAISKSAEVTLTGYNLEKGEYSVNIPTIEGLSITPTVFTVTDGQVNETFTVTFATEDRVTVATTDIVFSDGITSKTLPVTYGAMLKYTLQDVSENITWDFSKVPANPAVSTSGITATEDNQVMANIAGVANNADFNSQTLMMMVAGEYAYRSSSNKCFQGKSLKFNTTIPGMVTINARKAGDGCNVTVGNTNLGELTSTATDYTVFVEAGDVVISVEGAQPVRIYTMTFTAADHYRLGMKAHDLGTFCWPYDVPANQHFGAIFYNIEKADNSFVYFVEETGDLQAGKPYIFEIAEESQSMYVFNGEGDAVDAPDNENANGLYGTFESIEKTDLYNAGNGNPVYGINPANNKVTKLGKNSSVAAYRAYIVVVEISDISAQLAQQTQAGTAPRRLVLGRGDASVVTNLDGAVITNDEGAQKFIINNQLIMIRNGRIYNASGAMLR